MNPPPAERKFSPARLLGTTFQILAAISLVLGVIGFSQNYKNVTAVLVLAGVLQLVALTFLLLARGR